MSDTDAREEARNFQPVTHAAAREAFRKLHNYVYNNGPLPHLSIPPHENDVDMTLCNYIDQQAAAESQRTPSLEPLKEACDREWADETPEQIVMIAANAIYWRDREVEALKAKLSARTQAPSEQWMKDAAQELVEAFSDYGRTYDNSPSLAETEAIIARHAGTQAQAAQAEEKEFQNETGMVMFRAGLIACREYMARFVESESPSIAASIRANWWPSLGPNPGPPRKLRFDEVTDGGELGPWPEKKIEPSVEALPVAEAFLVHFGAPVAALEGNGEKK